MRVCVCAHKNKIASCNLSVAWRILVCCATLVYLSSERERRGARGRPQPPSPHNSRSKQTTNCVWFIIHPVPYWKNKQKHARNVSQEKQQVARTAWKNESSGSNSPAALFRLSGLPPPHTNRLRPNLYTRVCALARQRRPNHSKASFSRRLSRRRELEFNYHREGCKFTAPLFYESSMGGKFPGCCSSFRYVAFSWKLFLAASEKLNLLLAVLNTARQSLLKSDRKFLQLKLGAPGSCQIQNLLNSTMQKLWLSDFLNTVGDWKVFGKRYQISRNTFS